jgi:hypothetical protein
MLSQFCPATSGRLAATACLALRYRRPEAVLDFNWGVRIALAPVKPNYRPPVQAIGVYYSRNRRFLSRCDTWRPRVLPGGPKAKLIVNYGHKVDGIFMHWKTERKKLLQKVRLSAKARL